MMQLRKLELADREAVLGLFLECFSEDSYYAALFPRTETRKKEMGEAFSDSIAFCLSGGLCYGIWEGSTLLSFALCFDYLQTRAHAH